MLLASVPEIEYVIVSPSGSEAEIEPMLVEFSFTLSEEETIFGDSFKSLIVTLMDCDDELTPSLAAAMTA